MKLSMLLILKGSVMACCCLEFPCGNSVDFEEREKFKILMFGLHAHYTDPRSDMDPGPKLCHK